MVLAARGSDDRHRRVASTSRERPRLVTIQASRRCLTELSRV
jgi:hypothetical protein